MIKICEKITEKVKNRKEKIKVGEIIKKGTKVKILSWNYVYDNYMTAWFESKTFALGYSYDNGNYPALTQPYVILEKLTQHDIFVVTTEKNYREKRGFCYLVDRKGLQKVSSSDNSDNEDKEMTTLNSEVFINEITKKINDNLSNSLEQINKTLDKKSEFESKMIDGIVAKGKEIAIEDLKDDLKKELDEFIKEKYGILPKKIEIVDNKVKKEMTGIFHNKFEDILKIVKKDIPVMLTGPAGAGKNHTLEQVAEALDLDFYFTNSVTQEYKLTGFIDANGKYHETEFYKAFKNGGLFFLDEIDASVPEALIILNSAIANKYFDFPTGRIKAHKDFRVVCAGNTYGTGCLSGQTQVRIITDNNKQKHYITIENLYNQFNGTYSGNVSGLNRFATKNIKIRCVNPDTKEMTWVKVQNVINSGIKKCYKVIDENGNEIIATSNHPFLTESGWKKLEDISIGDFVYIDSKVVEKKSRRRNDKDYTHIAVKYHPALKQRRSKSPFAYPSLHRLVYEANMNNMELGEYIDLLNNYDGREIKYVDTQKYNIHHIDHNPQNNKLENLKVLTIAEHLKEHRINHSKRRGNKAILSKIVSIEYVGEQEVFDITCKKPLSNFMANNFLVHNCDMIYVGRNVLDGATLDRFIVIEFDYDEEIEKKLAYDQELYEFIIELRHIIKDSSLRYIVSMRATINASKLLEIGETKEKILKASIIKNMQIDDLNTIIHKFNNTNNEWYRELEKMCR